MKEIRYMPRHEEWDQLVQIYAVCIIILFIKYILSNLYGHDPSLNHEEDEPIEFPKELKHKIHQKKKDMESLPMHLIIFWAALFVTNMCNASGNGRNETLVLTISILFYTCFKVFYTIAHISYWDQSAYYCSIGSLFFVFLAGIVLIYASFQVDVQIAFFWDQAYFEQSNMWLP